MSDPLLFWGVFGLLTLVIFLAACGFVYAGAVIAGWWEHRQRVTKRAQGR